MRYAGNELGGVLYVVGGFCYVQVNEVMFRSFFVIKLVVITFIFVKKCIKLQVYYIESVCFHKGLSISYIDKPLEFARMAVIRLGVYDFAQ